MSGGLRGRAAEVGPDAARLFDVDAAGHCWLSCQFCENLKITVSVAFGTNCVALGC